MDKLSSENRQKETKALKTRYVLNQGTFMGLALVTAFYVLHLTGMLNSFFHNLLTWGIYIGFIHVSIIRYRDRFQEGLLSYGQGVWIGTRMGILAGIILGAYLFLYFKIINPGYIDEVILQMQESYLQMGMRADDIVQMEEMMALIANPITMIVSGVLGAGLASFLFSLIISIFQRRKGDPFSDAMKDVE